MSQEDPFLTAMKGKARKSEQISSADVWTPQTGEFAGIPRPDVNRASLLGMSIVGGLFGLDHLYMRSPWTGIAKMLTAGGFGLWWLWDICQLTLESDRVVKYGMTAPFDLITGIGQGMIYDGKSTVYKSEKSFGFWVVAKLLFGLIFDDHLWVALFKIIIFIATVISCVYISQGYWLWIIGLFFAGPLCLANIWAWVSDSYTIITNPTGFVKEGLPTPDFTYDSYLALKNWFINSKTGKVIEGEQKSLESLQEGSTRIFPLKEGITPDKLQHMFMIAHTTEIKDKKVQKGGAVPNVFKNPLAAVKQAVTKLKKATPTSAATTQPKEAATTQPPETATKDPKDSQPTETTKDPKDPPPTETTKDPKGSSPTETTKDPKDSPPTETTKDPNAATSAETTKDPKDPGELQNQGVPSGNPLATLFGRIVQSGVDNTIILGGYLKTAVQAIVMPPPVLIQGKLMELQLDKMKESGNIPDMPSAPAMPQAPAMPTAPAMPSLPKQGGGYRRSQHTEEPLSTEAQIMGATLIALIAGGSLKGLVDYIMPQ